MVVPAVLAKLLLVAGAPLLIGPLPAVGHPAAPEPVAPEPVVVATAACVPAQALDLTDWKVTLPIGEAKKPQEITQPALATFEHPTFFKPTPACDGVVFRAPVNGVTTGGSKYPRSELREMIDGGMDRASWSSGAGEHRFTVTEAFTHLPVGKPELVGVQIHDASDDVSVFRLEGSNMWITNGDNPHHKLITDRYVLGTKFEATYDVSGAEIRAYYNGQLQTTIPYRFRNAYFKTGAYTQSNCTTAARCADDNYGEVTVYKISVFHQVTTWQLIWDWIVTFGPYLLLGLVVALIAYRLVRQLLARRQRGRVSAGERV